MALGVDGAAQRPRCAGVLWELVPYRASFVLCRVQYAVCQGLPFDLKDSTTYQLHGLGQVTQPPEPLVLLCRSTDSIVMRFKQNPVKKQVAHGRFPNVSFPPPFLPPPVLPQGARNLLRTESGACSPSSSSHRKFKDDSVYFLVQRM